MSRSANQAVNRTLHSWISQHQNPPLHLDIMSPCVTLSGIVTLDLRCFATSCAAFPTGCIDSDVLTTEDRRPSATDGMPNLAAAAFAAAAGFSAAVAEPALVWLKELELRCGRAQLSSSSGRVKSRSCRSSLWISLGSSCSLAAPGASAEAEEAAPVYSARFTLTSPPAAKTFGSG